MYTDVSIVWTLPTVVDGKYQQTQNFTPNAFYFNIIQYTPIALTIEINSSTTSRTRTTATSAYWISSQQFTCPFSKWIFVKCYDANNRMITQVSYRNGQPSNEVNLIETQIRYLGTFSVQ